MNSRSKSNGMTVSALQASIEEALTERAYLRDLIIRNNDIQYLERIKKESTRDGDSSSSQSLSSLYEEIEKETLERDYLMKEYLSLTEENDDINITLDKLIEEKDKCCSDIERANAELKSCRELIDFLVLERDEMSKELDTKSKLLECYNELFNKDRMFHFREAKKK